MITANVSSKDFDSKGWTARELLGYDRPNKLARRRHAYARKKARAKYEKLKQMTETLLA